MLIIASTICDVSNVMSISSIFSMTKGNICYCAECILQFYWFMQLQSGIIFVIVMNQISANEIYSSNFTFYSMKKGATHQRLVHIIRFCGQRYVFRM